MLARGSRQSRPPQAPQSAAQPQNAAEEHDATGISHPLQHPLPLSLTRHHFVGFPAGNLPLLLSQHRAERAAPCWHISTPAWGFLLQQFPSDIASSSRRSQGSSWCWQHPWVAGRGHLVLSCDLGTGHHQAPGAGPRCHTVPSVPHRSTWTCWADPWSWPGTEPSRSSGPTSTRTPW